MEAFKRTLKWRVAAMAATSLLCALALASGKLAPDPSGAGGFPDYLAGFQAGMLAGLAVFFTGHAIRFVWILRRADRLKAQYIAEHDERRALIWAKSGGTVMYVCSIVLVLAAVAAGRWSPDAFAAFLASGIFLLAVKGGCKAYYSWKL